MAEKNINENQVLDAEKEIITKVYHTFQCVIYYVINLNYDTSTQIHSRKSLPGTS